MNYKTVTRGTLTTVRLLLLSAAILLLGAASAVFAQSEATDIDQITVDIWPDYDRAEVLVLITGFLPTGSSLPATVTVPMPSEASINAVARIGADGNMYADIEYDETSPGQLTFTTPDPNFRIEYYMPYETAGNERSFSFNWQSDAAVNSFYTSVQQPMAARELSLSPAAETINTQGDGLRYHEMSARSLAPGEAFDLAVAYTAVGSELSAQNLAPQEVPLVGSDLPLSAANDGEDGFNWLVVAGAAAVIILAGAGVFLFVRSQSSRQRVSRPRARRSASKGPSSSSTPSSTRFCHECGQPVDASDQFCRNCGAVQKQK